jgi:hypothetical protein
MRRISLFLYFLLLGGALHGWFNHKDDIYHLDTEALSAIREERQLLL